ncbi:MAG TPA: hypothetical protein VF525_19680 [Pyrinomonadaceae bacterium]|jgi:hypothetical protein
MDEQLSRERAGAQTREQDATGSSQDEPGGQAGAKPDPQGTHTPQSEGKPAANAAESGPPDQVTGEGTGARAGEYS